MKKKNIPDVYERYAKHLFSFDEKEDARLFSMFFTIPLSDKDKGLLDRVLLSVDERAQRMYRQYIFDNLSATEISLQQGISKVRACRIIRDTGFALRKRIIFAKEAELLQKEMNDQISPFLYSLKATSIDDLVLDDRSKFALHRSNCHTLGDLLSNLGTLHKEGKVTDLVVKKAETAAKDYIFNCFVEAFSK